MIDPHIFYFIRVYESLSGHNYSYTGTLCYYTQDPHLANDFIKQNWYQETVVTQYEAKDVNDFIKQVANDTDEIIDPFECKLFEHVSWDGKHRIITSVDYVACQDMYLQGMQMFEKYVHAWYNLNLIKDYTTENYKKDFNNFLHLLVKYIARVVLFDKVDFDLVKPECKEILGLTGQDYSPDEIMDEYTILAMIEDGV